MLIERLQIQIWTYTYVKHSRYYAFKYVQDWSPVSNVSLRNEHVFVTFHSFIIKSLHFTFHSSYVWFISPFQRITFYFSVYIIIMFTPKWFSKSPTCIFIFERVKSEKNTKKLSSMIQSSTLDHRCLDYLHKNGLSSTLFSPPPQLEQKIFVL